MGRRSRWIMVMIVVSLVGCRSVAAQRLDWRTRATLYADNTEFFTPYRVGETIMGGQLSSWLAAGLNRRDELRIGLFADRRWGSDRFVDSIKPILALRHATTHSLGVLGTLETVNRHGLLEPLMVTTRELTTPIEYGGQWIVNHRRFYLDAWLNWQKLNTPSQREQFELGTVIRAEPVRHVSVGAQHLWSHRGGQLYDISPVTNNHAYGLGISLHDSIGVLGRSYLSAWELWSNGHLTPYYPGDRPDKGHGTYLRAGVTPWNWAEVFAIHWIGRDYNADAGDNNYNSTGFDIGTYHSRRVYTEIGMIRRTPMGGGATFDAEFRFHNIDNLKSVAFFDTRWEISYRVVIRAPIDVRVR